MTLSLSGALAWAVIAFGASGRAMGVSTRWLGLVVIAGAAIPPGAAFGQAIERNPPPQTTPPPAVITPTPVAPAPEDNTPIGPELRAIVLLDASAPVATAPTSAVELHGVDHLTRSQQQGLARRFLGRKISRRLIGEIGAQVVRDLRKSGYPFADVIIPPQEITGGVLNLRIVEFRLGKVEVRGPNQTQAAYLESRIRSPSGQEIDAASLEQDLDELNRYPFRTVTAAVTPGADVGQTDLILTPTYVKPWRLYATLSNSGSAETGWSRIGLGAVVGALPIPDSTLAVQFTSSPDFFDSDGRAFPGLAAKYASISGRFDAPTWNGQGVELTFDAVQTHLNQDPFDVRQRTFEGAIGYRSLLSNFTDLPGSIEAGWEGKREQRATFFDGVDVVSGTVDVYQAFARWSDAWNDPLGPSALTVTLHVSPGDVDLANRSSAFTSFSSGRLQTSRYAYFNAAWSRSWRLPQGFSVVSSVIGQYATGGLPDTEQIGLGGEDLVRGYSLDEGAFDTGVLSRNELHLPAFPLLHRIGAPTDLFAPYVFTDVGHGHDFGEPGSVTLVSSGVGAAYAITRFVSAQIDGAHNWVEGPVREGKWRAQARLVVSY